MKKKNCYALFIGINTYDNPAIPNLSGCIKDAQRLASYIEDNLNTDLYQLDLKTLYTGTSTTPTRDNIIDAIRHHLGQATAGDMILLFYAGHGSKEKAHASFREADGNLQTLVPCDAREELTEGSFVRNILDKELRYLFYQLWEKEQPEIVFIQDSCHSTGATRQAEQLMVVTKELESITTAFAKEEDRPVALSIPLARFTDPTAYEASGRLWNNTDVHVLLSAYTAFQSAPEVMQTAIENIQLGKLPFDSVLPLAHHIHLAACDKHEFAYEIPNQGGVFTTHLVDILTAAENTISYQDLFNRIRMNIGGVYQQTPDLLVNSPNFKKRHEFFLGDLLQHGKKAPQRDIDVFKGFYPVVPKGRNGWQIKAGEMELLPSLDGNITAIPIEVFLQDQQPIGQSNAVIDYVASGYSQVTLTNANFDRRQHRNQLYAMIPPKYMRRWRIAVNVERSGEDENILALFEAHPPRKTSIFYQGPLAAKPLIGIVDDATKASFTLKAEQGTLFLYDQDETLLFQSMTVENENSGTKTALIQKPNDPAYYKYRKGKETLFEWQDHHSLVQGLKSSIPPVFDYLFFLQQQNPTVPIWVYCLQTTQKNAFMQFQEAHKEVVDYYLPFINWINSEKAEYTLVTTKDSFVVYPNEQPSDNETASAIPTTVPAFKATDGISPKDGFKIILALQKMCKWKTVQKLFNKLQLATLSKHQFEFHFKLYQQHLKRTVDDTIDYNLPHHAVTIQSWNATHFAQADRGNSHSVNQLLEVPTPIRFLANPDQKSIIHLDFSLEIKHLKGLQNAYISTLLLDSNYAVLPLQQAMGNNLLPPQNANGEGIGTLVLNDLVLRQPKQMLHFPQEIKAVTFYVKIFIAYQRFDISGLLQTGLPAATNQNLRHSTAEDGTRATVQKPPKYEDTGSWMSFTIPIVVEKAL